MPDYIIEPIETDFEDIVQEGIDYIQAYFPDWEPGDAQLDYVLLRFVALKVATTADMASRVMRSIFMYFGSSLVNLQPTPAVSAQLPTTWTALDNAGYTITAGTTVGFADEFDNLHLFSVDEDTTITAGNTQATGVIMTAEDEGAGSNGLDGNGELAQQLDWVSSIVAEANSSGGQDAETTDAYLDRLSTNFGLMSPRPVLAQDFALIARNVSGIWRAIALDNFIPPSDYAAANAVGVAALDVNGAAIGSALKTELDAYLQSMRQQNFIVSVVDPTVNTINVAYTAVSNLGAVATDVEERANAAVAQYIDPRFWGVPSWPPDSRGWARKTDLRIQEFYTVLNNVEGLDYVATLTTQIGAGTIDGSDKSLTGTFPITAIGSINGTVT